MAVLCQQPQVNIHAGIRAEAARSEFAGVVQWGTTLEMVKNYEFPCVFLISRR
jgi:hypothetical protein